MEAREFHRNWVGLYLFLASVTVIHLCDKIICIVLTQYCTRSCPPIHFISLWYTYICSWAPCHNYILTRYWTSTITPDHIYLSVILLSVSLTQCWIQMAGLEDFLLLFLVFDIPHLNSSLYMARDILLILGECKAIVGQAQGVKEARRGCTGYWLLMKSTAEEARPATFARCAGTHAHWRGRLMTNIYKQNRR